MTLFSVAFPTETYLDGAGGGRLFTRHWRPEVTPRASIVLCHGCNSHGGQYYWTAAQFLLAGCAVTALDLRGRGRSDGERFYVERIDDYVADLALAIDLARAHDPGLPLFLLGHGAGGVTALSYALDHQAGLAGLICESSAFRLVAPPVALDVVEHASRLSPHAHLLKLNNADFSRDPARVATLNADPYTHDEVQPVATVAALARAGERLERESARITLPLLILHGTADKATRPDGSQSFFDQAGSSDKTLTFYDGYYHDLLNDLGRKQVMDDILGWIAHRIAPPMVMQMPPLRA